MWRFSSGGNRSCLIRKANSFLTLNRRFHRFGVNWANVGHKADLCRDHQAMMT